MLGDAHRKRYRQQRQRPVYGWKGRKMVAALSVSLLSICIFLQCFLMIVPIFYLNHHQDNHAHDLVINNNQREKISSSLPPELPTNKPQPQQQNDSSKKKDSLHAFHFKIMPSKNVGENKNMMMMMGMMGSGPRGAASRKQQEQQHFKSMDRKDKQMRMMMMKMKSDKKSKIKGKKSKEKSKHQEQKMKRHRWRMMMMRSRDEHHHVIQDVFYDISNATPSPLDTVVIEAVKKANQLHGVNKKDSTHDFYIPIQQQEENHSNQNSNIINNSNNIPSWMKEYFTWHRDTLSTLNADNWQNHKFLIMQCIREDAHCGGASDRLKPLPFLLWLAYRFRRIFFIWWTRPCRLEEFLMPHAAINWTVPDFLPLYDWDRNGRLAVNADGISRWASHDDIVIVRTRMQSYEGGQLLYEQQQQQQEIMKKNSSNDKAITEIPSTYARVYHDLFRLLFRPSPPIAEILHRDLHAVQLIPGEYAVAHYRAFYAAGAGGGTIRESTIQKMAINAIQCASVLRPGGPVYFASDSTLAIATVQQWAHNHARPVVTITTSSSAPLHLDKAGNWTTRKPSDFYSIFVDLYLMGMGRCLTFGQGGFGRFGLLLGYNATCTNRHVYRKSITPCNWTTTTRTTTTISHNDTQQ